MELNEALDVLKDAAARETDRIKRALLQEAHLDLSEAIFPPALPTRHIEMSYVHGSPDSVSLTYCGLGVITNDNGMTNPPGFDWYLGSNFDAGDPKICVECRRRYDA